jgi:hypothetical protein
MLGVVRVADWEEDESGPACQKITAINDANNRYFQATKARSSGLTFTDRRCYRPIRPKNVASVGARLTAVSPDILKWRPFTLP